MSPTDFDWRVRAAVYAGFARTGRAPGLDELAATTGATAAEVSASLAVLADAHELVTDPSGETVWMAHPFSGVPTDYPVETPNFTAWANCAWDALGVPAILGCDGWTRTRCPQSGAAISFGVRGGRAEAETEVVIHLLTPLRHAWDDIGFT